MLDRLDILFNILDQIEKRRERRDKRYWKAVWKDQDEWEATMAEIDKINSTRRRCP